MALDRAILRWVISAYVVSLHVVVAVLLYKTDFITKAERKLGLRESTPWQAHYDTMMNYHKWMDENVPDNSIIFIGGSITQGLAVAAVAPYSVNYGIGGETTSQLLDAIPHYKSLLRAKQVVLAIGHNDLALGKKKGLNERLKKISETLPLEVPLIWCSVMPVKITFGQRITQSDIAEANCTIRSLCQKRGNCIFVETHALLADSQHQIIPQYFQDDGVHLSPHGYRQWITALRQAIKTGY